jgi:hypothetical protein
MGASFCHYQTGVRGAMEIESEGTARERGWQLPEWMRNHRPDASTSPVPKSEGQGAPNLWSGNILGSGPPATCSGFSRSGWIMLKLFFFAHTLMLFGNCSSSRDIVGID